MIVLHHLAGLLLIAELVGIKSASDTAVYKHTIPFIWCCIALLKHLWVVQLNDCAYWLSISQALAGVTVSKLIAIGYSNGSV
jgi:hypothetical protein